ncbi:hypothetical protein STEG23_006222 [Scotinomys teguina]
MSSGAGMAPQSSMAMSPVHLPALSPRRQLLTNGKPQFQATQTGGMAASLTTKPKQQEFGDPFSSNPEKGQRAHQCVFSVLAYDTGLTVQSLNRDKSQVTVKESNPMKESFDSQRGSDPQIENCYSRSLALTSVGWFR